MSISDRKISAVWAMEILDSRGNPTVKAFVKLSDGSLGEASVPSGASTGRHEALELRDGDSKRYGGKGVLTAVQNVDKIIGPAIIGLDADSGDEIDEKMISLAGGTSKKALGANAVLAVSLAVRRAAAISHGMPLYRYLGGVKEATLPCPMFNLLNGGAHAKNNIDIQEFMVVPHGYDFPEALEAGANIYHTLGKILARKGLACGVGDEGGYAPNLNSDEDAIELLCLAIGEAGYSFDKVGIALDVAASEWFDDGVYTLPKRGSVRSADQLVEYYGKLIEEYPIISIEDGLCEDDFDGWKMMTDRLGKTVLLVGDDLFVTNMERMQMGINAGAGNTILIKPNQIGTVKETVGVIKLAKDNGYTHILSHRSGDTDDTAIADIAVATGSRFIKSGAPCRAERVAKYNRLLEIYRENKA
jgi:enolase